MDLLPGVAGGGAGAQGGLGDLGICPKPTELAMPLDEADERRLDKGDLLSREQAAAARADDATHPDVRLYLVVGQHEVRVFTHPMHT